LEVYILPGQSEDIGLKHWKQIYKGTKHWKRLRKPYSQWAYVAAAFLKFPTRDAFWAEYSSNGRRLSWTQLTACLMQGRMKRDEMQAKAARAEYGDLTAHRAFRYTKSNVTQATTSARGIARIYRQLKGLHEADEDDVEDRDQ